MPVYNFECSLCGESFELHLHLSDDKSHVTCPNCGGQQARRVYSAPAITFKGQGFYATDSRAPVHKETA